MWAWGEFAVAPPCAAKEASLVGLTSDSSTVVKVQPWQDRAAWVGRAGGGGEGAAMAGMGGLGQGGRGGEGRGTGGGAGRAGGGGQGESRLS